MNGHRLLSWLRYSVSILALGIAPLSAQEMERFEWQPPPEGDRPIWTEMEQPLEDSLAADIDTLVHQLGSPSYEERQASRTRLMDIGPRAFSRMRDAYRATDDLETQLQIEQIVHDGYLDFFVFGRNAFLGIQQAGNFATRDADLRIREGHVGIVVADVIQDTAAAGAGFQRGDIIIALDGQPIPSKGMQVNLAFGESIRVKGPGARVTLTIIREQEVLEKDVILGSRPKRFYQRQGIVSLMLDHYRREFARFWNVYFETPRATAAPPPPEAP